jgi:hypothetical protein
VERRLVLAEEGGAARVERRLVLAEEGGAARVERRREARPEAELLGLEEVLLGVAADLHARLGRHERLDHLPVAAEPAARSALVVRSELLQASR